MAKTRTDVTDKITEIEAKTYANTIAGRLESIEDHAELIGIETAYLGLTQDSPKLGGANGSAMAVAGIINKGTISETVKEGETYTLAAGYYAGGTVAGIAGGGNYQLTTATTTPTEAEQTITAPTGYYGLSSVTVSPIPTKYKDTTGTDATAANVLTGKKFVNTTGTVTGSMPNNTATTQTLDATSGNQSYTIPLGYHGGSGKVQIVLETRESSTAIDPTESAQTITPTAGKVLSKVVVNAINKTTYLTSWTSDATAIATDIFYGKTAYINGTKVTGTMPDQSDWDAATHTISITDTGDFAINVPDGWHDGTGTVKVTAQSKTATAPRPGLAQQTITPDSGKVLYSVIVPALDAKYQDVSGVTITNANQVLSGYKYVTTGGVLTTGTMTNHGDLSNNVTNAILGSGPDGATLFSLSGAGYVSAATISLSDTIYDRLAAI